MAKKECAKRYPERDLAVIIVLAAVLFATMSFTKHNPATGYAVLQNDSANAALPAPEALSAAGISLSSAFCSSLPLIAYAILLILVIILITYLLRRHIAKHMLHKWWVYALYVMLGLAIFLTALEYILCDKALYSAIFAIAAVVVVFILDLLLTMIPKQKPAEGRAVIRPVAAAMPKPKRESIFDKLRLHAIKPAEPGSREMAELKQVLKELKELKKK